MHTLTPVGIDVASQKFDVAVWKGGTSYKTKVFPNTPKGFKALQTWLEPFGECHVCMEATGVYSEPLATFLSDAGYVVSVENPARIKSFGRSELSRNKTDKGDARMIARYCGQHSPVEWQPIPLNERKLRALVNRLNNLLEMKQMEENRLETADAVVQPSISEVVAMLDAQSEETRRAINDHIDNDPGLRKNRKLLESIPGIAGVLSSTLLAYLGDMSRFSSSKAVVAWTGLNPMQQESGQWKGKSRISKMGNSIMRRSLYMPAIVAMQYNPAVAALRERMNARNKSGKVVVCAAMKKLLQLAYGVLKSGRPFDAEICLAR
ncbi:IS110 family transposase [Pectobacterium polonicum]|uniref:IS110 family transposase n=1 Tax=Pectobacterium polonicum TaxID=2485124 RepID=A0AAE9NSY0_9GAMM|nr:IS110 family transposase [Pectobacterium polonicum]UVO06743.1 IS110 family transposase [Pectobacterium polonicum]UVO08026.1 IS110 family transposase [Pectobacterium polonicum]UVO08129.1 IS110 family transposase [Pectobacterium polonicum]UVO08414.1 IS110 family transposase [Pectobacterium polonicum]UVO09119.1 IS110 family transposase [Pectobacterium polonicum]